MAVDGVDPNWDVNFFFSGIAVAYSSDFQPFVDSDPGVTYLSQILNVAPGTTINASTASGQVLGVPGDGVSYGGSGSPENHFDTPGVNATNPEYSAWA